MKNTLINKLVRKIPFLYSYKLKKVYNYCFPIRGQNNKVIGCCGGGKLRIIGNNNIVELNNCFMDNIPITIYGNNNHVIINENVKIFGGNIYITGSECLIKIGKNTSIQGAHINAQEHNTSIVIGEDCMFSGNIVIRTSDSHPVYCMETGKRINEAKSVHIGNHVWLGVQVFVLKGCSIGNNSIIGTGSVVTHDIPANSIAVGIPAKVIKNNVNWTKTFEECNE